MNTLRLAAVAALALSLVTPSHAFDIHNDPGGAIITHALMFARAPKPIRIMGSCRSACTLALRYPSTCVGPGASLGFHLPYGVNGPAQRQAARLLMAAYPSGVRSWIRSRGGLTSRMITLSGSELRARVRQCI